MIRRNVLLGTVLLKSYTFDLLQTDMALTLHHHVALQTFVGFRLLSEVSPSSSILTCFLPVFDFQLF